MNTSTILIVIGVGTGFTTLLIYLVSTYLTRSTDKPRWLIPVAFTSLILGPPVMSIGIVLSVFKLIITLGEI